MKQVLKSIALSGNVVSIETMMENAMPHARDTFPTVGRLREMLAYDPSTGFFTWRVRVANVAAGARAGRLLKNGYRAIRLDDAEHYAHHLAWLYVKGEVPPKYLRFKNKNRDDCRIENLYHIKDTRFNTPLYWRERDLQRTFGISVEQYQAMHDAQGGLCAICHQPETDTRGGRQKFLAVDHDHETNVVRALLCQSCNTMIGKAGDSPERLETAAAYLRRYASAKLRSA